MPEESTTPDPLELTHRAYAYLNSRDLEGFVGLLARSCVFDLSRFDLGTYTGPDAIRRFYEEWIGRLYEFGVVVDDIESLGNGSYTPSKSATGVMTLTSLLSWEAGSSGYGSMASSRG
jgi:hypothetical protein